jgi:hypothetical protein
LSSGHDNFLKGTPFDAANPERATLCSAPAPGALRDLFRDFQIPVYREADEYGDWGGPP